MESDEDDKEAINKRELKTIRESFQSAKDSRNEERALKKKKLVEGMKDKLEKLHDEKNMN